MSKNNSKKRCSKIMSPADLNRVGKGLQSMSLTLGNTSMFGTKHEKIY